MVTSFEKEAKPKLIDYLPNEDSNEEIPDVNAYYVKDGKKPSLTNENKLIFGTDQDDVEKVPFPTSPL